jgi:hypothetical protein
MAAAMALWAGLGLGVDLGLDSGRAAAAAGREPSPVVYPPQIIPLTFDHAQHAHAGIDCVRCHAAAASSTAAADDLMPAESACLPCHAIDRAVPGKRVAVGQPQARCDACHPGFEAPEREPARAGARAREREGERSVPAPSPPGVAAASGDAGPPEVLSSSPPREPARVVVPVAPLKFNHKLHLERGFGCAVCHAEVETRALATTADLPGMALCLACHDGKQASGRCSACHPTLSDGRLRTSFPSGKLVPSGSLTGFDAHTGAFRSDHRVAGRNERACATCHKQSECTDCHAAGVVRPAEIHPSDYASLHAVDARRNVPDCASCHRNQSFCLGCHQRLGVGADPEGGQPGRQPNNPFGTGTAVKHFHPPGWIRDATGAVLTAPSPASHGFAAKRNLRACVSCHREESCLACHSADLSRSIGINPHGVGFAASGRCRALASRNQRACVKCHTPGAPELGCE